MSMLVLDASVTLAGVLRDQAQGEAARDILRSVSTSGAVVPTLWCLEVGNMLLAEQRRSRLTEMEVRQIRDRLARLPIHADAETETRAWNETLAPAMAHGLTLSDAAYLEFAMRLDLPLASLDRRLNDAAAKAGVALAIQL